MADESQVPQTSGPQGMAVSRPSFIPSGSTGTEHMTKDDFQIPRLGLAQGLSKEIEDGHEKFIPNLRPGMFFNNLTRQIFEPARGPLYFAVLRADPPRYIEFKPREQGGGVVDMNVAPNDPRTRFRRDADGKTLPPIATKFYDYVIMLLTAEGQPIDLENEMNNVIGLSLKGSGIKVARNLNGLMKYRNAPHYAGKYEVTSVQATGPKGTYYTYSIRNAVNPANPEDKLFGWLPNEAIYNVAKDLAENLKDKTITMDRDFDDHGDGDGGDEPTGGRM